MSAFNLRSQIVTLKNFEKYQYSWDLKSQFATSSAAPVTEEFPYSHAIRRRDLSNAEAGEFL
jgi:hypothetical protein